MLGYLTEDITGKPGTDFAPFAKVFEMEKAKNKKDPYIRELNLKRADGLFIDTEVIHLNMLQDPDINGFQLALSGVPNTASFDTSTGAPG